MVYAIMWCGINIMWSGITFISRECYVILDLVNILWSIQLLFSIAIFFILKSQTIALMIFLYWIIDPLIQLYIYSIDVFLSVWNISLFIHLNLQIDLWIIILNKCNINAFTETFLEIILMDIFSLKNVY